MDTDRSFLDVIRSDVILKKYAGTLEDEEICTWFEASALSDSDLMELGFKMGSRKRFQALVSIEVLHIYAYVPRTRHLADHGFLRRTPTAHAYILRVQAS